MGKVCGILGNSLFFVVVAGCILSGCSGPDPAEELALLEAKEKRAERVVIGIQGQIAECDSILAEIDATLARAATGGARGKTYEETLEDCEGLQIRTEDAREILVVNLRDAQSSLQDVRDDIEALLE